MKKYQDTWGKINLYLYSHKLEKLSNNLTIALIKKWGDPIRMRKVNIILKDIEYIYQNLDIYLTDNLKNIFDRIKYNLSLFIVNNKNKKFTN